MTYLFYIAILALFILGGLTLKYSYLECREAEKLYRLEDDKCGL